MSQPFSNLKFEPHNGYGDTDPDGDPWPFGYISSAVRARAPVPVFELGVVLEYPAEDLRKLAICMATAPQLLEALKNAAEFMADIARDHHRDWHPEMCDKDSLLGVTYAVIAKAEGTK